MPNIVRVLSYLAWFSSPLGKAAKKRDFSGVFFIFLIIVQYGTFSKHLKVLGFGFLADYYFDALDGK